MTNKFKNWLPLGIAITVICALVYFLAWQALRMQANDPQVEISEELSKAVMEVEDPAQFDPPQKLDISKSLSAYWIVYSQDGKALAGNGQINNSLPEVPVKLLEASNAKKESRVTWQPSGGADRQALVIRPYEGVSKGYVAAGRSLRELDFRLKNLMVLTTLGWIVAMAASLLASLFAPKPPAYHAGEHKPDPVS